MSTTVLWEFERSVDETFVIEVGDQYFRFYKDRTAVLDGLLPYELATPYAVADIPTLKHRQINDTIRITHPSYEPRTLTRVADDNWTLTTVDYFSGVDSSSFPPFLDQNITDTTLAADSLTGTTNLVASAAVFEDGHIGAYFKLIHTREAAAVSLALTANGVTSSGVFVPGDWTVVVTGTFVGTLILERTRDNGASYETVATWILNGNTLSQTGEGIELSVVHRLRVTAFTSQTNAIATLNAGASDILGVVKITSVSDSTHAVADVIRTIQSVAATKRWAEGAWSIANGFPSCCELHEGRLVYAGTDAQPRTVRGSCVDDFNNFEEGTDDDLAYAWTIGGRRLDRIVWLLSESDLFIGTTGSVTRMRGNLNGDPITPTRVDFKTRLGVGCANVPPVLADGAMFFVERKTRKVRALSFEANTESFTAIDVSLFAEHMLKSGVVAMAWQADAKILWCVTGIGDLVGMSYDREQEVHGWHRHDTDGVVESVACISGDDDATDETWLVVARPIGANTRRFVESFDTTIWARKEDYYGVDCGLTVDSSPVLSISGLDHLIGMYVDALVDGVVYRELLVDEDGAITLPDGSDLGEKWHVGLPYTAEISPFRLDRQGRVVKIADLVAQFADSIGGTVETENNSHDIEYPKDAGANVSTNPPLFTGWIKVDWNTNNTRNPILVFRQEQPLPFSLVSLKIGDDVSQP